jgi:hypothetical protein
METIFPNLITEKIGFYLWRSQIAEVNSQREKIIILTSQTCSSLLLDSFHRSQTSNKYNLLYLRDATFSRERLREIKILLRETVDRIQKRRDHPIPPDDDPPFSWEGDELSEID